MYMTVAQIFLLMALIGSAAGLKCHYYQLSGNKVVRDDASVDCRPDARFCYKYIEFVTDDKGNKYNSVYKGCANDAAYTVPGACRVGAECKDDGKAATLSSLSYGYTYSEDFYCCSKDLCNSAEQTMAGVGLALFLVVVTSLK